MTSFNVAGLLQEPPGAARDVRLRDHYVTLGPDVELAGPLDADLRLQRTNRGILVRGEVTAPIRRVCARCTEPFVDEVTAPIEEEFVPTIDPVSGAPVGSPSGDEDGPLAINAHHEIDLAPVLHDELALTEPMVPLHSPDCPGLCAECGERLDRGEHDHATDEIDPRLAGLRALLPDEDPNGSD